MKVNILLIVISLAGCATQPPIERATASGSPEGVFRNTTVEHVQSLIANRCLDHHKTIEETTPMQVTCSEQVAAGMPSVATLLLVGGDSASQPFVKFRFTTIQLGADVRVVVNTWLQNVNPPGPDNKVAYMPNAMRNNVQTALSELGAE